MLAPEAMRFAAGNFIRRVEYMTSSSPLRQALRFNAVLAGLVVLGWLVLGGSLARHSLVANWPAAVTMVFGSIVSGGTSEGGGAVAFPVFTKVLHIPPSEARLFAFAIQSIGMSAASLSILYQNIPIDRRVLPWAGPAGVVGLVVSTYTVAPFVPAPLVRIAFTVMLSSLGVAMLVLNGNDPAPRHARMPIFGAREKILMTVAGFVGGMVSALIGVGENIVVFMVMVLLFRVSERVVTPTTVLLMTIVTIPAFCLHIFLLRDFSPQVEGYWLAAVPVVVVGAPLGAVLSSRMSRRAIANTLIGLIALELVSTVVLIPISTGVALTAAGTLLVFGILNGWMSTVRYYRSNFDSTRVPQEGFLVGEEW
jgi:uncharacterized protein